MAGSLGLAGCTPASPAEGSGTEASRQPDSEGGATNRWLGEAPSVDPESIADEKTCALLIIGAGNAGMTAAVKAAESGIDFMLVDKQASPSTPRNAIGAINDATAQEDGFTEDPFKVVQELVRYSSGKANTNLLLNWARESGGFFDWVAGIMDEYGFDAVHTADRGIEENPAYYCAATEHRFAAREGSEFAKANRHDVFLDYIRKRGYDLEGNLDLVTLSKDDAGRVCGAVLQDGDGSYVKVNAENVLLATGGYADNPQMMEDISPAACRTLAAWMLYPGNTGQGIKAAMWAGAEKDLEPTPMLFDRGAVAPGTELGLVNDGGVYSVPQGYITTTDEYNPGTQPFMKVSKHGKRFANEAGPYTDIVWAASNQPGGAWCQVFDSNYAADWEKFHTLGCSALARLRSDSFVDMIDKYVDEGLIVKADTVEELADGLGFEGDARDTFLASVERYNELYDKGSDDDFGKPAYKLSAIRQAPFYGVWLGTTLLTTADGIKIDESCRALGSDHLPIKGLYVAGDCAGGFFANNYPYLFPGMACGRAMYEGWKAVTAIASE